MVRGFFFILNLLIIVLLGCFGMCFCFYVYYIFVLFIIKWIINYMFVSGLDMWKKKLFERNIF